MRMAKAEVRSTDETSFECEDCLLQWHPCSFPGKPITPRCPAHSVSLGAFSLL